MELVFKIIFYSAAVLFTFALYVFLLSEVFPKYLLRVKYNLRDKLGRGLEKFVYESGRSVIYEPAPSIRKYINAYVLFTHNGYKYIEFRTGAGVESFTARIVTIDNRDKVINVIDVSQKLECGKDKYVFSIHEKTSYVALLLTSVNKIPIYTRRCAKMRLIDMPLYFAAVVVATFSEFIHIMSTTKAILGLFELGLPMYKGYYFFVLPTIAIGALCLLITVIGRMRKGVEVVLK